MSNHASSKISQIEFATAILNQALQQLYEHDYPSAQVTVAVARKVLEDLQLEFDQHFQVEARLKQFLKPSLK